MLQIRREFRTAFYQIRKFVDYNHGLIFTAYFAQIFQELSVVCIGFRFCAGMFGYGFGKIFQIYFFGRFDGTYKQMFLFSQKRSRRNVLPIRLRPYTNAADALPRAYSSSSMDSSFSLPMNFICMPRRFRFINVFKLVFFTNLKSIVFFTIFILAMCEYHVFC